VRLLLAEDLVEHVAQRPPIFFPDTPGPAQDEALLSGGEERLEHGRHHPSVGPGKDFTQSQKQKILKENESRGGGLTDDRTGESVVRTEQHQKGVTPPSNEAHVDHVVPKSKGGSNSFGNAEVRSRENNLRKGNKEE